MSDTRDIGGSHYVSKDEVGDSIIDYKSLAKTHTVTPNLPFPKASDPKFHFENLKASQAPLTSMTTSVSDADQRAHDLPSLPQLHGDPERHAHPNFAVAEASRPPWREESQFLLTKTKQPGWKFGDGANDGGESLGKAHVEIDPYGEGRPSMYNYKLLISGIVPRPIGFISTRSEDGREFLWSFNCSFPSSFFDHITIYSPKLTIPIHQVPPPT